MKTKLEIEQLIKEKENYKCELSKKQVLNLEDYRFWEYEKKYTEGYSTSFYSNF